MKSKKPRWTLCNPSRILLPLNPSAWPTWDESLTIEEMIEIAIQVNGKARDRITVAHDAAEETVRETALASDRVRQHLAGRTPSKVIYIPGRLINIVG